MTRTRISVVGGGLAGLTAAAFAARAGASVTVYEARQHEGGRARSETHDGFVLNQGAHALYDGTVGIATLRELGIEPRGTSPDAANGWGTLRGRLDLLPGSPKAALRTKLIPLAAKAQLGRLLAAPKALVGTTVPGQSMRAWIDAQVKHPDARALVAMLARTATYDADMDVLDATAGVEQMIGAFVHNVRYLDGGWQQLVDALRARAEEAGAKVASGEKIGHVDELDDADAVIVANGGPRQAAALLEGRSTEVEGWVERATPVHATAWDLALRRLPVPERRVVLGVDAPLYFSCHTPAAKLAPVTGGEVVHLFRYGDADAPGVDARAELEAFFDRIQPGWRAEVVTEQFGHKLVVTHDRPATGRGFAGRAPVALADCPGVFLAGDWVGTEGMLADCAFASGKAAALAAVRS